MEHYCSVQFLLPAAFLLLTTTLLLHYRRRRGHYPPGPFPLPIVGNLYLLRPNLHRTFHDLSLRYGPIFQLYLGSSRCVVISSTDIAKEFLKAHDLDFAARMNSTATRVVNRGGGSFSFNPYGPYYKFAKKLVVSDLLGQRSVGRFGSIRTLEVRDFLGALAEKGRSGEEAINVTEMLLRLTSNMITNMMLGIRCSESGGGAAAEARTVVRDVTQIFGEFNVSDMIWFCKWFDFQGIRKRSEDIRRRFDALVERIISAKEAARGLPGGIGEAKDFLDMLLDVIESGESEVEFTKEHLKPLILDLFVAGTDTTAIATEWAMVELISNPDVLMKAQQEIDKVVGFDRLLMESDAPNLHYLQAIIQETLRLHPPIPLYSRIAVSDCVVGGYTFPTNTILLINNWSISRDPKYWESPLAFNPDRFLEKENRFTDVKSKNFELLPFGAGRRGCVGQMLAMHELILIIGTMVQCFDWKLPHGSWPIDMSERPGLATPRANDLLCHAVPRIHLSTLLSSP